MEYRPNEGSISLVDHLSKLETPKFLATPFLLYYLLPVIYLPYSSLILITRSPSPGDTRPRARKLIVPRRRKRRRKIPLILIRVYSFHSNVASQRCVNNRETIVLELISIEIDAIE